MDVRAEEVPMQAGVYARLSRKKATEELTAAGMERQEEDCRALCDREGWQVVATYDDEGISAAVGKHRPAFEQALADLSNGVVDVLVIAALDRFVRSLWDMLRVERVVESGGRLISVGDGWLDTADPNARFILRQRAMVAEMELENIRRRVARRHRQRAEAGAPLVSGRRPFGYVTKDRSVVDEIEAAVIRNSATRLLSGVSLRRVVAELEVLAPSGRPWQIQNYRQMLLSSGIAGYRSYKGEPEFRRGTWEPVLDEATWRQVRALLLARSKPGRPAVHLLSGFLECGLCGASLWTKYRVDGVRQYTCEKRAGPDDRCGKLGIKAEPVEQLIERAVLRRLAGPGLKAALAALDSPDADRDKLLAQRQEAERVRDDIEAMFQAGDIKRDAWVRMHGPAVEQVERIEAQLGAVTRRSILAGLPDARKPLERWWHGADTAERREVLSSILIKVVVGPSGPRMSKFDASRLDPKKGYGPIWSV
jgi:site-specific DNA recombinase